MASWMGQTGTYKGPSLEERQKVREASKRSFYVRTSKETTKLQLHDTFSEAGCVVLDTRVVFTGDGNSTGVAYVDVADEASISAGLALDGTELNGSKLSVRRNMDKKALKQLVSHRRKNDSVTKHEGSTVESSNTRASLKAGNDTVAQKVCYDFLRGKCTRANCRFAHVKTKDGQSIQGGSSAASLAAYASSSTVCRDYSKGQCRRGASCRFLHSDSPKNTERPVKKIDVDAVGPDGVPVCRDFLKGKCRRATCRFWHGGTSENSFSDDQKAQTGKRSRSKGAAYGQKPPPADYQVKKKQKIKNQNQKIHRAKTLSAEMQVEVDKLLKSRQSARDEKNWKEADRIRDMLKKKGIVVKDTKAGPVWDLI